MRFAHAKSYGIVRASVEIESGLAPEYAQGIYAIPATYEAVIRFSNGLGHLGPDVTLGPIFGVGLKLFDVPGHSILENDARSTNFDYAMINAPVFFANTAKDYVVIERLFDALPGVLLDPRTAKSWLHDFVTSGGTLPPDKWLWDELFAFMSLIQTPWQNPLLASYWTEGAVRHGEYVAKLRITAEPSAAAAGENPRFGPPGKPGSRCGTRSWRKSGSTISPSHWKHSCVSTHCECPSTIPRSTGQNCFRHLQRLQRLTCRNRIFHRPSTWTSPTGSRFRHGERGTITVPWVKL